MDKLTIILRTCDNIEKFSSIQQHAPRIFGTKKEIIERCFDSLSRSIENCLDNQLEVELHIVDDNSSEETRNLLLSGGFKAKLSGFNYISLENTKGNGASLKRCYELARDSCEGSIFFIEDDYLFEENALYQCYIAQKLFMDTSNAHVVIHPVDYIDRYKKLDLSYITLAGDRHWRSIKHTTGTFLITKEILMSEWDNYMAFTKIGNPGVSEDTTINKVYENYFCLSPIPTLAEHLQEEFTLSPFSRLRK